MLAVIRHLTLAAIVGGVSTAMSCAAADAAVVTVPTVQRTGGSVMQRQTRSNMSAIPNSWHPHKLGPHVFYGKITAMNGSVLTLHLRNGHILDVDATTAIANGDYSAPLYVGKLVSVDGVEANGTFTAAHVFRVINLNSLRADQ